MFIFNIILKQLPSNKQTNKQTKTSSFIGNKLLPQKKKQQQQNQVHSLKNVK